MRKETHSFEETISHLIGGLLMLGGVLEIRQDNGIGLVMMFTGISIVMAVSVVTQERKVKDINTSDIILLVVFLVLIIGGIVIGGGNYIIIGVSIWLIIIYIVELVFR